MSSSKKKTWKYEEDDEGFKFEHSEETGSATVGAIIGAAIAGPTGAAVGAAVTLIATAVVKKLNK